MKFAIKYCSSLSKYKLKSSILEKELGELKLQLQETESRNVYLSAIVDEQKKKLERYERDREKERERACQPDPELLRKLDDAEVIIRRLRRAAQPTTRKRLHISPDPVKTRGGETVVDAIEEITVATTGEIGFLRSTPRVTGKEEGPMRETTIQWMARMFCPICRPARARMEPSTRAEEDRIITTTTMETEESTEAGRRTPNKRNMRKIYDFFCK
ncbi:hypothetical protein NQ314_008264 [Rhamnusium bicolor]|uniref:Uncharacterized protein n=1 Tax=Rhamnusium bicolor TaxID=1586634 RepID=A0AAV8YCL5_9CUCU|nr:hypothetical protein NQ314_008264 [Rhamnusium bicolor]